MRVDRPTAFRGSAARRGASRWLVSMGLVGLLLAPFQGGRGADAPSSTGSSVESQARLVVEVVDAEGKRVPGALVTVDGLPAGKTDGEGRFVETRRAAGDLLAVGVRAPGTDGTKVQPIRLVQGDQTHVLALDSVVVIDVDGDGVSEPGDKCIGAAEVVNT